MLVTAFSAKRIGSIILIVENVMASAAKGHRVVSKKNIIHMYGCILCNMKKEAMKTMYNNYNYVQHIFL